MAYQINKTDGTIVATVADGQVDDLSTDITLIGKNFSGFGEAFNENLIKLLEHFSSNTAPIHPIKIKSLQRHFFRSGKFSHSI